MADDGAAPTITMESGDEPLQVTTVANEGGIAATTTAVTDSPLLKLAAELRNKIYELVAEAEHVDVTYYCSTSPSSSFAATCQQIWKEYVPVLEEKFKRSSIDITLHIDHFDQALVFVDRFPVSADDLKRTLSICLHLKLANTW